MADNDETTEVTETPTASASKPKKSTTSSTAAAVAHEHKLRMITTGVAVFFAITTVIGFTLNARHDDGRRPNMRSGNGQFPFGGNGGNGNGQFPGGGNGNFPGGGNGGRGGAFGGNALKSQFFDSDGSLDTTAVNNFVKNLTSENKDAVINRLESQIDNLVNNGDLTEAQGKQLTDALNAAK